MCFSATASFVASAVLIPCGIAAMVKFRFTKKEWALGSIPIIFGLHQLVEGIVWLGITGVVTEDIKNIASHIFTFVAMCFWPIFIPLSLFIYEYPKRHLAFSALLLLGMSVSIYLLWCFTVYSDLYINVRCCDSISYVYSLPYLYGIIDYFYVAVVVIPYLLSSNLRIRYLLGPGFFLTFIIALVLQSGGDYPSIWCFLAAALSIIVIYSLRWRGGMITQFNDIN